MSPVLSRVATGQGFGSIVSYKRAYLASQGGGGPYQISRSLRFNSADSAYLNRTPAGAGNRKTWTWAGWVKRSKLGTTQRFFATFDGSNQEYWRFDSNDTLRLFESLGTLQTTQVFRDVSAWYHIVVAVDTTQATTSDRIKFYLNGTQVTTFSTATYPSQNADGRFNSAVPHYLGTGTVEYFDGYLADVHFIDGQALTPSSFTETSLLTGQLIPKTYSGSYGTNGFKLNFSSNASTADLGTDTSGNGNTWTTNNFSVTAGAGNDSLVDTPTSYGTDTGVGAEVRGNYATLNALDTANTLSNGNLQLNNPSTGFKGTRGTVGMSSGKWYFETTFTAILSPTNTAPALYKPNSTLNTGGGSYGNNYISIVEYPANTLNITLDGWSSTAYSQAGSLPVGTIVGIAFDADSGKIWFSTNGTWLNSGNPAAGTGAVYSSIPAGTYFFGGYAYSTSDQLDFNFGARSFAYTAPSGFKALVDTNLPAPAIVLSNTAFDTKLYTGNGGTQTISGLSFSPDFVWFKLRSDIKSHALYDVIRGGKAYLRSNGSVAEQNYSTGGITAFNSDGFTIVEADDVGINVTSGSQVAWAWDAGTSTVTNTSGSISAQVRANPTAGFSVVTWTTTSVVGTVGHGLGVTPSILLYKRRDASQDWYFETNIIDGSYDYLILNSTATKTDGGSWSSRANSSTITSFTGSAGISYVAYCFAPVAGYSAFGSYTGNGSADGPFVYTGHRSRWVMVKRTDSVSNWTIWDTSRDPYNYAGRSLYPNLSNAEDANTPTGGAQVIDVLSNGFKLRDTGGSGQVNASGGTYIFASFAESPFQYARAR
jgi:hypothetical protein